MPVSWKLQVLVSPKVEQPPSHSPSKTSVTSSAVRSPSGAGDCAAAGPDRPSNRTSAMATSIRVKARMGRTVALPRPSVVGQMSHRSGSSSPRAGRRNRTLVLVGMGR